METTVLRFARGSAGTSELQREIEDALAEADGPSASAAVGEGGQGADPALTSIVVTLVTTVGGHAATRMWDEVIWPRIKRRLADDALGPREED